MAKIKIYDFIVSGAIKSRKCQENPQVLTWINDDLDKMMSYYKHVFSMEQRVELARATMDLEDFQQRVMQLDQQRKAKHDAAIAAIKDLDSCTRQAGFGSCLNVDDLDKVHRTDIAEAIYDFCDLWVRRNN
jgi:murein endopeptidase